MFVKHFARNSRATIPLPGASQAPLARKRAASEMFVPAEDAGGTEPIPGRTAIFQTRRKPAEQAFSFLAARTARGKGEGRS